jgi:hypothetical protein
MISPFKPFLDQKDDLNENALKDLFIERMTSIPEASQLFEDAAEAFAGEELVEVTSEIVETFQGECGADDFHSWNYDHLEFIIDLSNKYNLVIPKNLLNGLPEQLILLVNAKRLGEPGCK